MIIPPESDDEGEIVELTGDTSIQGTPEITMQSLDDIEWGFYYKLCPKWSDFWNQTQGDEDWPEGVRVFDKKCTTKTDYVFLNAYRVPV